MCGLRVQVLVIMERIVSSKRVEMLNVCLQFLNEFVVIDCWLQRHCEMISGAFYRDEYFILKFDPSPLFFVCFLFSSASSLQPAKRRRNIYSLQMDRKNRTLMRFPNLFENLSVEEQKVNVDKFYLKGT